MTTHLRIGILGAARIADEGIVAPARTLGHELVAVAARDRARAESFAAERGIVKVHDTYADVIADPDVDLVYNAPVNSLHAQLNIAALKAGKHVLSEKPLTSNAGEARAVRAAARASSGRIVEGFHHLHHPVNLRLRELVTSGALGDIRRVDLVLATPAPPDTDPRWSRELAGGATMDLGCYVLDAALRDGRDRDLPDRAPRRAGQPHRGRDSRRPSDPVLRRHHHPHGVRPRPSLRDNPDRRGVGELGGKVARS